MAGEAAGGETHGGRTSVQPQIKSIVNPKPTHPSSTQVCLRVFFSFFFFEQSGSEIKPRAYLMWGGP